MTIECPECAGPIPVNGVVPEVLCTNCQTVVPLRDRNDWSKIFTYEAGEGCMEHKILVKSSPCRLFDYFLAFGPKGGSLYRRHKGILVEVEPKAPRCTRCHAELDTASLVVELHTEGRDADAFCPGCGASVAIRAPTERERNAIHPTCVGLVGESAPRGDLSSIDAATDPVLFSCMGCGAPASLDGSSRRIFTCGYCGAANYVPDALWLRLHPAARKRPFFALFDVDARAFASARKRV
ncbi:MAG: hypothetical protein D6705_17395 [Deltaproteobacteria bacterium]|nr:MAG: hypothetical protein D6705_17395 [Deltaproteobacteria bacterium]